MIDVIVFIVCFVCLTVVLCAEGVGAMERIGGAAFIALVYFAYMRYGRRS